MHRAYSLLRPVSRSAASLPVKAVFAPLECAFESKSSRKVFQRLKCVGIRRYNSSASVADGASAPVPIATSVLPPAAVPAEALAPLDPGPSLAGLTNIIDKDDGVSVVTSHDKYGFTVNNIHMRGSVIVFRNFTLLWNVTRVIDISPRNLAIAHMVRPRPELLLVGTGEKADNINPALYAYMARRGISIEALSTPHAIATFNLLTGEGRPVAVALVSRTPMPRADCCLYTHEPLVTEADKRLQRALARDLNAEDAQRLLAAGSNAPADMQPPTAAAAARESAADAARRAALAAANAPPPSVAEVLASDALLAASASGGALGAPLARWNAYRASEELSVRYGYPGAAPPDPHVVDGEASRQAAQAQLRAPSSAEEADWIAARAQQRRSVLDKRRSENSK